MKVVTEYVRSPCTPAILYIFSSSMPLENMTDTLKIVIEDVEIQNWQKTDEVFQD